jgi:hypothetical protein
MCRNVRQTSRQISTTASGADHTLPKSAWLHEPEEPN